MTGIRMRDGGDRPSLRLKPVLSKLAPLSGRVAVNKLEIYRAGFWFLGFYLYVHGTR
jgi:hypothetical protein